MKTFFRVVCFFLVAGAYSANCQDSLPSFPNENYYDLTLEELMNVKISVASVKELTSRESPGIVTLITGDDIKNTGARDLMDVLQCPVIHAK